MEMIDVLKRLSEIAETKPELMLFFENSNPL